MRLSICTIAAASASIFVSTLAAPTAICDTVKRLVEESESKVVRRDGDDGKYFHEPGYVSIITRSPSDKRVDN